MESEIDGEWEIDDIPIPQSIYVPLSDVDALGVLGEEFEDSKEGGETRREYDEFKAIKRRLANKDHQRKFRERKKKGLQDLQSLAQSLTRQNLILQAQIQKLSTEKGVPIVTPPQREEKPKDSEQVNREVGEVKETLADFRARLDRIERVRMNATKSKPWERVEIIGRFTPGVGYEEPKQFPTDARDFWKLKLNTTERNIQCLSYLVQFYGIDDYQYWDTTRFEQHATRFADIQSDSEQSQSDSAPSSLSLEAAVRKYPSQAVEKVAAVLGLVEENFTAFYASATRYQQQQQYLHPIEKRQSNYEVDNVKRAKLQARSLPTAPKPTLSIRHFVGQDSKSESHQSEETRLEYGGSLAGKAQAVLRSKIDNPLEPRTPSGPNSEGSTTVPNESPSLQGAASGSVGDILPSSQVSSSRKSRKPGRKARMG